MRPYDHIERYGNDEVQGIDVGTVYVFPKLDGTNARVGLDEHGDLRIGSRNRIISPSSDNHGFAAWCNEWDNGSKLMSLVHDFADCLGIDPRMVTVYGEWLVPHTLKTYRDDAWHRFYIFDVHSGEKYVSWQALETVLGARGDIDYLHPLAIIQNPTEEQLRGLVETNTYLIKDGEGVGEGVVIKNYSWMSQYGRQPWAKIVRNEFKEANQRSFPSKITEGHPVEADIASRYVTRALVDKERAKLADLPRANLIPALLGSVYHCVVVEELWGALKKFKQPTIDFRKLAHHVNHATKLHAPDLF